MSRWPSRTDPERFWAKVRKGKTCWEWTGAIHVSGYGHFGARHGPSFKTVNAHRYAWILHHGAIPLGLHVLHRCDNRRCVRPDHLFLGTDADNVADMVAKGRQVTLAGEGHGRAKLGWDDIAAIRTAAEDGESQRSLAKRHGVVKSQIARIVHFHQWKVSA